MRFAFHVTAQGIYGTDNVGQFRPFDRIETALSRVGAAIIKALQIQKLHR